MLEVARFARPSIPGSFCRGRRHDGSGRGSVGPAFHSTFLRDLFTKTDGDSRGGAALSIVSTIRPPINSWTGREDRNLEPFTPTAWVADPGNGHMLSLIEKVEHRSMSSSRADGAKGRSGEFTPRPSGPASIR